MYDSGTITFYDYHAFNGIEDLNFIEVDSMNNIWVGTDFFGLYSFDGNVWKERIKGEFAPLRFNIITSLSIDAQNNKWVAVDLSGSEGWKIGYSEDDSTWTYYIFNSTNIQLPSYTFGIGTTDFRNNKIFGLGIKGLIFYNEDSVYITSISENRLLMTYNLRQNYPNPFNPSTKLKYSLPKQGLVTIKVYDVLGKEITQLVNEEKPLGEYEVEFDGSSLSSGIYFYQIQAGEFLDTKKMVLMK